MEQFKPESEKPVETSERSKKMKIGFMAASAAALFGAVGCSSQNPESIKNEFNQPYAEQKQEDLNITKGGSWAIELAESIKDELPDIKTNEDADAFVVYKLSEFEGRFRMPSTNSIKLLMEHISNEEYESVKTQFPPMETQDDFKIVHEKSDEMLKLLESLKDRITPETYEYSKESLKNIYISTSYAGYKRYIMANNFQEYLNKSIPEK